MKTLGCEYWFEVYLGKSTLDAEAWNTTLGSIMQHIGALRTLKLVVQIQGNMVHYYIGANKNLAGLSNKLEKVLLRPISSDEIALPERSSTENFVQFVTGGNLLDLRERYEVNRGSLLTWSVFSIHGLTPSTLHVSSTLFFESQKGWTSARKQLFVLPGHLIAINFRENEKFTYKKRSKHLDIKKSLHMLQSSSDQALFEVDTFPYLPQNGFISLSNYDFDRHSFIIGATGSGKSKLISLFIDRLLSSPRAQQYRVVVIDPHASLEEDLAGIRGANVVNFKSQDDSAELFADTGTDISAATELTGTLFRSLLGENFNPKVERMLRFSLIVLMTSQVMSLDNLKRLLTNETYRSGVLEHVKGYVPENIHHFFTSEFKKIEADQYTDSIVPILELIDEIQLQPSMAGGNSQSGSLAKIVSAQLLTIFSLDKVGMGEKVVKTVAGLLIQQLFLLVQSRTFGEKIILIIDEVSVVQNPTIAQILAEARKYNLFVFLTQQYFGQIDQSLQNAIFSNVSNYYVFKVSEHDARELEGNITMELPKKMLMESTRVLNKEEDLRVPILTELDPRDCIVRLSSGGKILPAVKARTLDFAAPVRTGSSKKLHSYEKQRMPVKYTEPSEQSSASAGANKPQLAPVQSTNLMEILAKKSSHRNNKVEK